MNAIGRQSSVLKEWVRDVIGKASYAKWITRRIAGSVFLIDVRPSADSGWEVHDVSDEPIHFMRQDHAVRYAKEAALYSTADVRVWKRQKAKLAPDFEYAFIFREQWQKLPALDLTPENIEAWSAYVYRVMHEAMKSRERCAELKSEKRKELDQLRKLATAKDRRGGFQVSKMRLKITETVQRMVKELQRGPSKDHLTY
jgi:hypothetical protein